MLGIVAKAKPGSAAKVHFLVFASIAAGYAA